MDELRRLLAVPVIVLLAPVALLLLGVGGTVAYGVWRAGLWCGLFVMPPEKPKPTPGCGGLEFN